MSEAQDFYFVHFDPLTGDILNWMAIQQLSYDKLPSREHLLPVTKEQFDTMHRRGRWAVKDGQIVEWTPPTPIMPSEEEQLIIQRGSMILSAFQLRSILNDQGYLAHVEEFIATMCEKRIQLAWLHERDIKRLGNVTEAIQEAISASDTTMDEMFISGALISG